MKALNIVLAVVVSLVLCILVLEGGLRLIGLGPPKTLNEFDSALGWTKRPGAKVTRKTSEYEVTFEMNSLGMRDDELASPEKPAGRFRVIALGDSFTLGFAVEREDLFVDLLEAWWRAEGRDVEILNTGTEGYSTDQEARWMLEHGDEFAPDLVLLFPYENDIYWNGQERYQRLPKPRFNPDGTPATGELEDPGGRGFFSRLAIGNKLASWFGDHPQSKTFTPRGGSKPILEELAPLLIEELDFLADPIARTRGSLIALKAKCDELGAKLVIVPIPSHSSIDPDYAAETMGPKNLGLADELWSPDKPVELFLEIAREPEVGIIALDVRPEFRRRHDQGEKLYFDIDWHINPAGNRALATFLHDQLEELGVFPASHAKQRDAILAAATDLGAGTGLPGWSKLFAALWLILGVSYALYYRDENPVLAVLKVGGMLTAIFTIAVGGTYLIGLAPPLVGKVVLVLVVLGILGFVLYKLGDRIGTILELLRSFVMRGHWYLLPLVVVLLTVGSLLVVAASSPLIAPFIYTLF